MSSTTTLPPSPRAKRCASSRRPPPGPHHPLRRLHATGHPGKKARGHLYRHPGGPKRPARGKRTEATGTSPAKIPVVALHEAYPGHHLQLVWSNRQETIARRMGGFLATLFIEGWAFYCEELLEKMGYIAQPVQRLGRLQTSCGGRRASSSMSRCTPGACRSTRR